MNQALKPDTPPPSGVTAIEGRGAPAPFMAGMGGKAGGKDHGPAWTLLSATVFLLALGCPANPAHPWAGPYRNAEATVIQDPMGHAAGPGSKEDGPGDGDAAGIIGHLATLATALTLAPMGRAEWILLGLTTNAGLLLWLWRARRATLREPMPQQRPAFGIGDADGHGQAGRKLRLAISVFEAAQEGIVITDTEGDILDVNPAFTRLTGYPGEEVLGRNPRILKSGRHGAEFYAALWRELRAKGSWRGEIWNRKKDGSIYLEWMSISTVADGTGRPSHYIGTFYDITLLKLHERRLEYVAYFDPLTGVPNRALLADRMNQAIAYARREERLLAVAYLDLDEFKPVNDRLGHEVGDELLVEVAQRIKAALRAGDTVARLGGDEFAVVLPGLEKADECLPTLRRLLARIAEPLAVRGHPLAVSASIGVCLFPEDDSDPDTLLRHADQAMCQAKQAGKNRVHLYDPVADSRARHRHAWLARIEQALSQREFALFYQPKVDLRSGRVQGAEALIRWHHPERGLVPPGEFLPLIETHALGVRIDRWVMEEALRQMTAWNRQGLDLAISVNLTAQSLQAPGFVRDIKDLLARFPTVEPRRLELEILESAALDDIEYISGVICECQALGLRFALDDFGTGYSSLAYLKHLPAEVLKIDQSFVRDMLDRDGDRAIVEGVVGLGRVFRRQVVAEGVETMAHAAHLLSLGCDMAQGYGIARPMPAEQVPGWIEGWQLRPAWMSQEAGTG